MSPLRTLRQIVRPAGRHRATGPGRVAIPLDDLLGPQLVFPEPPVRGVLTEAWRYCQRCRRDEPSVLHTDGWTCGHCFNTTARQLEIAPGDECQAELIDGSHTYCGCEECAP
jgi:hypothetical protein